MTKTVQGRIIRQTKTGYLVDSGETTFACAVKGTLRKQKVKPVAGDLADIEIIDQEQPRGIIAGVQPRKNLLTRPILANIDQIFLITTIAEPAVSREVVDRFLVSAAPLNAQVLIVFNKNDLLLTDAMRAELEETRSVYERIGYRTLSISAREEHSMKPLFSLCRNVVSAFAGVSGVGKSTVLNSLFPDAGLKTGELSIHFGRGTHTTTTPLLLRLPDGGYVADTPGFAFVNVPFSDPVDMILHYPELRRVEGGCRFNNCLHHDEPGCLVRAMVDNGEMAQSRYRSYVTICDEMRDRKGRRGEGYGARGGRRPMYLPSRE